MKVFGDLHLGLNPSYREGYYRYIFEKLQELIGGDKEFCSTGDVFHNAGSYNPELMYLIMYRQEHYFPVGNGKHAHDIYNGKRTYEEVYGLDDTVVEIAGKKVFFQSHKKFEEIADFNYDDVPVVDVIITHNFLHPVVSQVPFLDYKKLKKKCGLLLAGHYHKQMDLDVGVHYIGSLVNTDFGSANEKGRYYDLEKDKFVFYDILPFVTVKSLDEPVPSLDEAVVRLVTSEPVPIEKQKDYSLIHYVSGEEVEEVELQDIEDNLLESWEQFASNKEVFDLGRKYLRGERNE